MQRLSLKWGISSYMTVAKVLPRVVVWVMASRPPSFFLCGFDWSIVLAAGWMQLQVLKNRITDGSLGNHAADELLNLKLLAVAFWVDVKATWLIVAVAAAVEYTANLKNTTQTVPMKMWKIVLNYKNIYFYHERASTLRDLKG